MTSLDIYNDDSNIQKYILILFISIYPLFLKNIRLIEKMFWVLSLNSMISIVTTFCTTLSVLLFGQHSIVLYGGFCYAKIISILMIRGSQIISAYIFSKNTGFTKYVSKKILIVLGIICILNQLASSLMLRDILINPFNRNILILLDICIIFAIQVLSFYMLNIFSKEMERAFVLEITLKANQNNEKIMDMYQEMRGWRHDFKNHMSTILGLIEIGEKESSIEYIYELDSQISKLDREIYTENIAIDCILTNKIKLAKEKNIDINLELDIKREINIHNVDMCIILGNLIDNSIEACEKVKSEKRIDLKIITERDNIIIKIRNKTDGKLREDRGRFLTTKSYGVHGIGLGQIDSVVKKYGGYIKRTHENNIFDTSILMQCNNL